MITDLEAKTRLMEIVAELETNEQHSAAIREQALQLIQDMNNEEEGGEQ